MFAAVGLITATGAFTTVEAERTADVEVAGDANALLTLEEGPDNPEYLDTTDDQIVFDITAGAQDEEQLNLNALTVIEGVINVTNNGNNEITLSVSLNGDNAGLVEFNADGTDLTEDVQSVTLTPGETVTLDFEIDTTEEDLDDGDEIIDQITFEANAN